LIPIRDTLRSETYPLVNYLLIVINSIVFLIELSLGQGLEDFIYLYGLVPARYSLAEISSRFAAEQQIASLVTFMFLHGGFLHLLGNMWFLYIFGDNIEDHLGHLRYLVFYLLSGLASGLFHLVLNWGSNVPTIGASGAVAGVMGAYFLLHPKARVLTLVPIFFFIQFVEVPAFVFLGIWFIFQFLSAGGSSAQAAGVAWWAHVGGFLFGMVFLKATDLMPRIGAEKRMRAITRKRGTPRLQLIHPTQSYGNDEDQYGSIPLTQHEARHGTRKLVSIQLGPSRRNLFLTIPPGVSDGSTLRFRGLGRATAEGEKGDLYLKVRIQE